MSFLTDLEAKVEALWQRLADDEHPAAVKAEEILNDVKAEAGTAVKAIETDAAPVVAESQEIVETAAKQAVETVAADVVKDVVA